MKTNKSFTKRLKVTRNGKIISRAKGQNHFNAKESAATSLSKGGTRPFVMTKREQRRFLPGK